MNRTRRFIVAGATAVSLLAAATVAGVAAGGGFGQAPGQYSFSDTTAFVLSPNQADGSLVNLTVDRGRFLFKPKGGGGFHAQNSTILNVAVFGPPDASGASVPIAEGCFTLQPSQFVVGSNLQSASIDVSLAESDSCSGAFIPLTGSVPTKDAGGGGGGGNFGFAYPLDVAVTWTGTGAVSSSTDQGRFTCQTFQAISHNTNLSALSSSVAISISGFPQFTGANAFGNVNATTNLMQVTGSGVLTKACGGVG